jgi:hypothetical protein
MGFNLETALEMAHERQQKGHAEFYRPLPEEASKIVREHYNRTLRQTQISENGCNDALVLKNDYGTIIATGYRRVVIGDYGAYIEFTKNQLIKDAIGPKWPGDQSREAAYIWCETKDASHTKVYLQQHKVQYANYKPGMYYVSPDDVFIEQVIDEASKEWREFTRVSVPQHTFEAKRASGGEVIGNPENKLFAKNNQWFCRNPENDHTWICSDKDFWVLYRLVASDGSEPHEKKSKKRRRTTPNRKKLNEVTSLDAASQIVDCGPLFDDQ